MKEVISYLKVQDKEIGQMTIDMMIFWMKITSVQVLELFIFKFWWGSISYSSI